MKVLVSRSGVDLRDDDFRWTADGELLMRPAVICTDAERRMSTCGCGRSFVGAASAKATTVGVVEERDESDVDIVVQGAWAGESWREAGVDADGRSARAWFAFVAEALDDAPVGTVVRVVHDEDSTKFEWFGH